MRQLALALALAAALPALARAQADLLATGRAARAAGDHAAALAAFDAAWQATTAPIARAEMAIEELALGRFALAETHATEALAFASDPEVAARASELAAVRDAAGSHLGSLDVGGPLGATIAIDGVVAGTIPLAHLIRLEAGTHALHVTLTGFEPADAVVEITAGTSGRTVVRLTPFDERPILERTGETGDGQRIAGWAGLAAGGVALVIGGVALGVELDRDAFLRSDACAPISPGETRESRCADAASTRATYTDVARAMLLAGAVLGIAGVVLLLTAPSEPTGVAARCVPSMAPGVVCEIVF